MTKLIYSDIDLVNNTYSIMKRTVDRIKFSYFVDHTYWNIPEGFMDYLFGLDSNYLPDGFVATSDFPNFRKFIPVNSYDDLINETIKDKTFIYNVYKFLSEFRFDHSNKLFKFHYMKHPSNTGDYICGIKTALPDNRMENGYITSKEVLIVNKWATDNNLSKFTKGVYDAYCKLLTKKKVNFYVPFNINAVIQEEEILEYVKANRQLFKKETDDVKKFIYRTNLHMLEFTLRLED